jgi:Flp pilus assembly protein TadG
MNNERNPMRPQTRPRDAERGQIIVIFALAIVAIIGMVGLVIDGGSAFSQRRTEQKVADVAALAGANAYMNTTGSVAAASSAAIAAARVSATRNGYTDGVSGATVGVSVHLLSSGARVRVTINAPHHNTFARVMGMATWNVGVNAGADAAVVDTAVAAAPWIMNIGAFNPDGSPKYGASNPIAFGEANGDYPVSATDIAWTDFNGDNNVNTNEVSRIIDGRNVVVETIEFGQYIGQHNSGEHTALYGDVNTHLAGDDVPIPVVGPCPPPATPNADGCFKGWAMFHVVSASGGSDKTITGYFLDDFISQPLTVGECTAAQQAAGTCGVIDDTPLDSYFVRLSE